MKKIVQTGLSLAVLAGLFAAPNVFAADPHEHLQGRSIVATTGLNFELVDNAPMQVVISISQVAGAPMLETPTAPPRPTGSAFPNPPGGFFFQEPDTTLVEIMINGELITPMGGSPVPNEAFSRHSSGQFHLQVDTCPLNPNAAMCGPLEVTWNLLIGQDEVEYSAIESRMIPSPTGQISLIKRIHSSHHFSEVSGNFVGQGSVINLPPPGFPSIPEGAIWQEVINHRNGTVSP